MNRAETAAILSAIKVSYPRFYAGITKDDAVTTLSLWTEILAPYEAELVTYVVKQLITTSIWPPTIADITTRINAIGKSSELGDTDLWILLLKAISNSYYGAEEEYAKLPYECQRFAGSPGGLRQMGLIEVDVLNSVTKGQFLRQIGVIRSNAELLKNIPNRIKQLVAEVGLIETYDTEKRLGIGRREDES